MSVRRRNVVSAAEMNYEDDDIGKISENAETLWTMETIDIVSMKNGTRMVIMSKDSSLDYVTAFVVAVAVDGATVIVVWIVQRVRMTYVYVYVYVC